MSIEDSVSWSVWKGTADKAEQMIGIPAAPEIKLHDVLEYTAMIPVLPAGRVWVDANICGTLFHEQNLGRWLQFLVLK
jgi:hypothetical protein